MKVEGVVEAYVQNLTTRKPKLIAADLDACVSSISRFLRGTVCLFVLYMPEKARNGALVALSPLPQFTPTPVHSAIHQPLPQPFVQSPEWRSTLIALRSSREATCLRHSCVGGGHCFQLEELLLAQRHHQRQKADRTLQMRSRSSLV